MQPADELWECTASIGGRVVLLFRPLRETARGSGATGESVCTKYAKAQLRYALSTSLWCPRVGTSASELSWSIACRVNHSPSVPVASVVACLRCVNLAHAYFVSA